jgi:hypothetical protein
LLFRFSDPASQGESFSLTRLAKLVAFHSDRVNLIFHPNTDEQVVAQSINTRSLNDLIRTTPPV